MKDSIQRQGAKMRQSNFLRKVPTVCFRIFWLEPCRYIEVAWGGTTYPKNRLFQFVAVPIILFFWFAIMQSFEFKMFF